MKPIHPICEASCKEHYGKPVLIYLKDGGEVFGVLSRLENNQLILNEDPSVAVTTKNKKKGKAVIKGKKGKKTGTVDAATSAYPFAPYPYPPFYPGGRIVLDIALIALLFVLI
ncbi:hypothetical protein RAC89_16135 [Paenibacillus sp. GD4]|uniref:hypothetical protein n=1 Tax=Paenibacillus sp. GD4 TaxID=3068890 RepID=UPI002796C360|nr:hypothetical protein [Paenibacillus sp. GD4]MDQ1911913.1 hypothetical protein [Paenibacillus sp. GD4]